MPARGGESHKCAEQKQEHSVEAPGVHRAPAAARIGDRRFFEPGASGALPSKAKIAGPQAEAKDYESPAQTIEPNRNCRQAATGTWPTGVSRVEVYDWVR